MIRPSHIATILFLLTGAIHTVFAQDPQKADSLKTVLARKQGKERMDVLWELVKIYWHNDTIQVAKYIEESYRLARKAPVDSLFFVKTGRVKAMLLSLLERYDEAFVFLNEVLPVARRHGFDYEVSVCLNYQGVMYSILGKYDKALYCQLECLRIRESLMDTLDISVAQNNLGLIYYKAEIYSKALHYYFLSLKSKQAIGSHRDEDLLLINISLCYLYLNDFGKASAYARKGISLCNGSCSSFVSMSGAFALGLLYWKLDRLDSAKVYLRHCYEISSKENSYRYKSESLVILARLANNEGLYREALRYSMESEENALKIKSRNMAKQTYYEMSKARRGLKDYEGAAMSWDKYLVYHDSLFDEILSTRLISWHIDFEQEQNKTFLMLQESTVKWQHRQNSWIATLGVLLFVVLALLIYDFISRKRETRILETLVHDRTRALAEQVRALEREEMERRAWEEKLEKAIREGAGRLDVLSEMAGRNDIKAKLPN